jgi:YVTN family beta-propeller protein
LATVLFTDIVGSTELTANLGDRGWRQLIARHHSTVRRLLKRFGGRELDTAGDGFFALFDRPAPAIECACAIVDHLRPLGISIRAGIHMGECEVMGDKVGGIAVVTGARVMASAAPGEVLVTGTVRDLVAGSKIRFSDRGIHELRGVPGEWQLLSVDWDREASPEGVGTALRATIAPPGPMPGAEIKRPWRRRTILVAMVVAVAVAAGAVVAALVRGGPEEIVPGPNTVARIDPSTSRFTSVVPVGELPNGVAIGEGAVWVITQDRTLYRIDPESGKVIRTIGLPGIPTGIAVEEEAIWVAMGFEGAGPSVLRINPNTDSEEASVTVAGRAIGKITVAEGAVWAISGLDNYLSKIDPATNSVVERVCLGDLVGGQCMGHQPVSIASGQGALWVANALDQTVWRIDPKRPKRPVEEIPKIGLSAVPTGLAVGSGRVWVTSNVGNWLAVINARTNQLVTTIPLGKGPTGVAADDAGVWVAEGSGQEVVRVDPVTLQFRARIAVPAGPDEVVVGLGTVWVTIHPP